MSLISLLLLSSLAADPGSLVRVQTPTAAAADMVRELGLDVWTEAPTGPWLDVRLEAGDQALLDLTGLDYEVRVADLGPQVEAERLRLSGPVAHGGMPPDDFFADYAPLDAIEQRLVELAALRPDLVTQLQPGQSFEGRPLQALMITAAPDDAPAILLDAGQHSREWIAIASTTCVADRLVREADTAVVAALLSEVRIVVLPVVNPDGYLHTWDDARFWRKNRRPPDGVDLNRNYGVAFGGEGASDNPNSGNYHGEAAFSEPEAVAIRDLAASLDPLLALVDVHSYGQLVLYPWGFQFEPAPADDVLAPAAQAFSDGMSSPFATDYVAIPGAELYPASGNIMDWAYGELGAYAYGLEMRPGPDIEFPEGFVLPPEDILPVCDELFEGFLAFSEVIVATQPPGAGDDGAASGDDGSTGDPPDGTTGDEGSSGPGPQGGTAGSTGATSASGGGSTTTGPAPEGTSGIAGTSSSGGEPADGSESSSDGGCGCTTGSGGAPLWLVLLLAVRRRAQP